jgi:DNA modification methylase
MATIKELVTLCKEKNIKGYSGKNKSELLKLLSPNMQTSTSNFTVGDNLDLLKAIESDSINLIYMDPPYNTGRNFYYFEDRFDDFPKFMKERLIECFRVLKKDGNIIIHVEPKISHHIRVICDSLNFHFKNEIVWNSGGNSKNKYQLGRNHDTLIVCSKSAHSKFFPMYQDYPPEYKKKLKMCPVNNKLYSTSAAHNSQPEVNPRPNLVYLWNGNTKQWYVSLEKMQELHNDNRLEYNAAGIPRIKRFLDELEGIPIRDTWDDICSIQSNEKTRYATQKPIKLLERVIQLYSAETDLCLDPFAGSGTLGRACIKLNRKYLLFDINPEAKEVFEETKIIH